MAEVSCSTHCIAAREPRKKGMGDKTHLLSNPAPPGLPPNTHSAMNTSTDECSDESSALWSNCLWKNPPFNTWDFGGTFLKKWQSLIKSFYRLSSKEAKTICNALCFVLTTNISAANSFYTPVLPVTSMSLTFRGLRISRAAGGVGLPDSVSFMRKCSLCPIAWPELWKILWYDGWKRWTLHWEIWLWSWQQLSCCLTRLTLWTSLS